MGFHTNSQVIVAGGLTDANVAEARKSTEGLRRSEIDWKYDLVGGDFLEHE